MKDLYYIGEVSSLLGISSQTLRYYDRVGLVQPAVINEQTGYRQYTYDQIHFIERIKYLQNLGLSLTDIQRALASSNPKDLVRVLHDQKQVLQQKIKKLQEIENCIDWYVEYYQHIEKNHYPNIPFKVREPERHMLAAPFFPGDSTYGSAGYRLTKEKSKKEFEEVSFLRQVGYILDFQELLDGNIRPQAYFVYLKDKPELDHSFIRSIPAGEYLCFRGKILTEDFDPGYIRKFFGNKEDNKTANDNRLVVANEYEDNFHQFMECVYEIQILL
ncbi:MAG: MerR family transcriptional regulator [Clostridiales bacterium]